MKHLNLDKRNSMQTIEFCHRYIPMQGGFSVGGGGYAITLYLCWYLCQILLMWQQNDQHKNKILDISKISIRLKPINSVCFCFELIDIEKCRAFILNCIDTRLLTSLYNTSCITKRKSTKKQICKNIALFYTVFHEKRLRLITFW